MLTREVLIERMSGLGGSDAATLLDANPYQSRLSLYISKVQEPEEVDPGDEPRELTPDVVGSFLEGSVRSLYEYATGRTVGPGASMARHPEHDFMIANTDGTIEPVPEHEGPGVWECKATTQIWGTKTSTGGVVIQGWGEGVPMPHEIQVQHYMAVTGLSWSSFGAMLLGKRGDPLARPDIERNDAFIEVLVDLEREFWTKHVLPRAPPPPDGSKWSQEALRRLHPNPNGRIYVLPSAESNLLDEWLEARSNATTWEKSAKSIKQQLEARMGDDEFLVVDGQDADDEAALTMSTENRAAKVKDVLAVVEERHGKDERKAIEAEVMSRRKKGRTLRVTTVAKVREKAGEEA